jgi:uncharacterized protein with PQ loop repeat
MVVLPPARQSALESQVSASSGVLQKMLGIMSAVTMLSTIPQVLKVWTEPSASGVSLVSWAAYLVAAILWFIHGFHKHDKSMYLACIGWIILDSAIVIGLVARTP